MNAVLERPTPTEPDRRPAALTPPADREHLLAQIAQGLLTAHARLDLMEDRLKEVTGQAVADGLLPGLAQLEQVRQGADDRLAVLTKTLLDLDQVEDRLRQAAIDLAQKQLADPVNALRTHEATASKHVSTLREILASLNGIEVRFETAGRDAVAKPVQALTEAITQLRGHVQKEFSQVSSQSGESRDTIQKQVERAADELRALSSKNQKQELDTLATVQRELSVLVASQAQTVRQEASQHLGDVKRELQTARQLIDARVQGASSEIQGALRTTRTELIQVLNHYDKMGRQRHRTQLSAILLSLSALLGVFILSALLPRALYPAYLYLGPPCLLFLVWGLFLLGRKDAT